MLYSRFNLHVVKHYLLLDLSHFIINTFTAHKGLIATIGLGFVAGLIAQFITPGKGFGFIGTIAVGIASCFISNMFLTNQITFVENHIIRELIGGILIAIIITLVVNMILRRDHKEEKQHR